MTSEVQQLRKKIDTIDHKMLECLAERIETVKILADKKKSNKLSICDIQREEKLRNIWMQKAEEFEIDIDHACRILNEILIMSKKTQKEMIK